MGFYKSVGFSLTFQKLFLSKVFVWLLLRGLCGFCVVFFLRGSYVGFLRGFLEWVLA